jgi:positive regulator of sigma E activity
MEEFGEIVKIAGDTAEIRIKRSSKCHTCGICSMDKGGDMIIPVEVSLIKSSSAVKINDKVKVEIKDSIMLRNIFILYFLPLCFLVGGYFFGCMLSKKLFHFTGEFINIVFSFLFLLIFKMLLKMFYNILPGNKIYNFLTISKVE